MELAKNIGGQLRKIRKSQGLTMKQVADMCDMHAPNLSLIERGLKNVSIGTLSRVADVFGCRLKIKVVKGVEKVEVVES